METKLAKIFLASPPFRHIDEGFRETPSVPMLTAPVNDYRELACTVERNVNDNGEYLSKVLAASSSDDRHLQQEEGYCRRNSA